MKIVVTAKWAELESAIDPRFGRAPWLVAVDTETGEVTVRDNQQATNAAHGAGVRAARLALELGAQAVITGNIGPNAFRPLQDAGIKVYLTYAGTVEGTVARLLAGRLTEATAPSKRGH